MRPASRSIREEGLRTDSPEHLQVLNSDDAPDVTEYNKGNATSAGLLASQGLLTNLNDYVSEYGWDKIITGSLADTGKYDEQGMMGSGDWYGITTGAVK